jgi:hypothetical protein
MPGLAAKGDVHWFGRRKFFLGTTGHDCWRFATTAGSGDFDVHFADLGFDFEKDRVLAQGAKVRILGEPFEIPVAEGKRFLERVGGRVHLTDERVAAGEVVEDEGIVGFEAGQFFVDLKALIVTAALGVVIPEKLEGFDVFGIAPHDALHELDFDIQVFRLPAFRFLSRANLFRHTTVELFPR